MDKSPQNFFLAEKGSNLDILLGIKLHNEFRKKFTSRVAPLIFFQFFFSVGGGGMYLGSAIHESEQNQPPYQNVAHLHAKNGENFCFVVLVGIIAFPPSNTPLFQKLH